MSRLRNALVSTLGVFALQGVVECFADEVPLWTAAQIQHLAPQEARQQQDVRLRGVVTFTWNTGTTELTVEDQTGAVWIPTIALPSDCRVGVEVEIEGVTDAGIFGPYIHATRVRRLGPKALPTPQPASIDELLAAPMHGRRVELTGIVRRQRVNPELGLNWLALEVTSGGSRITVNVTHEIVGHPELIDAKVRIRGVNLHTTDTQQQAFLPMINANSLADLDILTPASPDPYGKASANLSDIMRSASVAGAGHRVRAHGTVTFVSEANSFFLQDETRGIQVFCREPIRPAVGEAVDVIGFPEPGAFSPVLQDADWRPAGPNRRLAPIQVAFGDATKHDGQLISVIGRLVELIPGEREAVLVLEEDSQRCRVHVANATIESWQVGSILRSTGVCSVDIGGWESLVTHRRPKGFSLLVQDPASITLVRSAPWWTPTRFAWAFALVVSAACCALGFVWLQARARLRETTHTQEIARAQFAAVLAERNRFAREIHDTLAQGFAGISVQLEVLNDQLQNAPSKLRRHLDLARELVKTCLSEARRSVWNLRAQTLEEKGLVGALSQLGTQLTDGEKIQFNMLVEGTPRSLPPDIENNLLRAGQEALTNSVRHSAAKKIALSLSFLPDSVRLSVVDDGTGFDASVVHSSPEGGHGLSGLRERAAFMHATLEIACGPDGGTTIDLQVPHV